MKIWHQIPGSQEKSLLSVVILPSLPKPREPAFQCDIFVFLRDHREGHSLSSHPEETEKKNISKWCEQIWKKKWAEILLNADSKPKEKIQKHKNYKIQGETDMRDSQICREVQRFIKLEKW